MISNKDGDLLSQFDNNNEYDIPILARIADLPPQIRDTPHQKLLIDNHTDGNKSKVQGYLYLKDFLGFCISFKNVTKNLGFHLLMKTIDSQDTICTSMGDDINVSINNLYLFFKKI